MMPKFVQLEDELKYVGQQTAVDDDGRRRVGFKYWR
jgi:hypothetical protein